MVLREEDERKILEGRWKLDCPHMELSRPGAATPEHVGPGWIEQVKGALTFKLFATTPAKVEPMILTFGQGDAGKVVPPDNYYDLNATDCWGSRWHAIRILPDENRNVSTGSHVFSGSLIAISQTREFDDAPPNSFLRLEVIHDIEFPALEWTIRTTAIGQQPRGESASRNAARLSFVDINILLIREEGRLTVEAASAQALPPHFEIRLVEALQFILARPIWWTLMEWRESKTAYVEVRRFPTDEPAGHMPPAIQWRRQYDPTSFWRLCEVYLAYVSGETTADWHPVSAFLRLVIDATSGAWDARALALGVAVEGILRAAFAEIGFEREPLRAELERASNLIGQSDLSPRTKELVGSAINNMREFRPQTALHVLEALGAASAEEVRAWKRLRNRFAHAGQARDFTPQELCDLCYRVTTLLYRLVFTAIGYSGPYTNYGQYGWETAQHICPSAEGLRTRAEGGSDEKAPTEGLSPGDKTAGKRGIRREVDQG